MQRLYPRRVPQPHPATYTTRYATRDAVVYAQPASSSARLGYVPQGTAVRVIGQSGECFQVLNGSGMSCGYIYSGYLSSAPVEAYEPTPGYTTVPVKVYASPSTSSSVHLHQRGHRRHRHRRLRGFLQGLQPLRHHGRLYPQRLSYA